MKNPNFRLMKVLSILCCCIGGILFSQGISFAMPWQDKFEPATYYILRDHAVLLSIGGIGLLVAGILGGHLTAAAKRILEGVVDPH